MKVAVIYTMKGCPHCTSIKEELNKENIPFLDRDINEFEEEYDEFSKATQNDFVPALMLLTLDEEENATDVKQRLCCVFIGKTDWEESKSCFCSIYKFTNL